MLAFAVDPIEAMEKSISGIKENIQELRERLAQEEHTSRRRRLRMLLLFRTGQALTHRDAARILQVHRNSIGNWLSIYKAGGIDVLMDIGSTGPPSGQHTLPQNVLAGLKERLSDPSSFRSYVEIQEWLRQTHGLEINYKTLYRIVRYELNISLGRKRREEEV